MGDRVILTVAEMRRLISRGLCPYCRRPLTLARSERKESRSATLECESCVFTVRAKKKGKLYARMMQPTPEPEEFERSMEQTRVRDMLHGAVRRMKGRA